MDGGKNEITFETPHDSRPICYRVTTLHSRLIFGADGAFSATRLQHQLQHDKFDYQQHYIDCGYKELTIPPTKDGNFSMHINALHIWPRKDYMLIALPNL